MYIYNIYKCVLSLRLPYLLSLFLIMANKSHHYLVFLHLFYGPLIA